MSRADLMVKLTSSALGLGYLPVAPGTWGSAGAAGAYWLLRQTGPAGPVITGVLLLAVCVVGVWTCPAAIELFGASDPGRFVLDELAGCWLTCLLFWGRGPLVTAAAAFVAFRVFDILKPFPLRALERLPGAWGVMADDLGAALYAAGTLWILGLFVERLSL